jgi:hypothetical protein
MSRSILVGVAALGFVLSSASTVRAENQAEQTINVGVFMPVTILDGQQRYAFAERVATALMQRSKVKAVARNFARFADFAAALRDPGPNGLDIAIVDGWVVGSAAELPTPIALGVLNGESRSRWALVSSKPVAQVTELKDKTVAVTRVNGTSEAKFLRNVIFDGQFDADKELKVTLVPGIDSALKAVEVGTAQAALLPAEHVPKSLKVVFQSSPIPIAAVLLSPKAAKDPKSSLREAILALQVAPFDKFVTTDGGEFGTMRQIVTKGPPPRRPVLADAPPVPFEPKGLVTLQGLDPTLPFFPDLVPIPTETPDD